MENKMTKAETLALIKELCAENEIVVAYCDNELANLAKKAEKARARAAAKRAEGDELYNAVIACVGTDPITCEAVHAMIEGEDLTIAKIRAKLSAAVRDGVLVKETLKVDGKNKVHYHVA